MKILFVVAFFFFALLANAAVFATANETETVPTEAQVPVSIPLPAHSGAVPAVGGPLNHHVNGAAHPVAAPLSSVAGNASAASFPFIEAELPFESPEATNEAVCFPADATVILESGEVMKMENLQVGHRVQVGVNQFSDVVMFTHALADVKSTFVQLTTASGKTIRATEGHFIYADGQLTRMRDVVVGNLLETSSSSRTNEQVARTNRDIGRGLYNPQTAHGDIIVDGIRASTYTETIPTKAAHALLAPVRAAFVWTGVQINALEKIVAI